MARSGAGSRMTGSAIATQVIRQYSSTAGIFSAAAYFEKEVLIAPALAEAFNAVVRDGDFDKKKDKIVDFGCGPFLLGLPFLRDGYHVDGIDVTPGMLTEARRLIGEATIDPSIRRDKIKLVRTPEELEQEQYSFGMMNFVHQCCPDRLSLKRLFIQAKGLMRANSKVVLVTTHPDYLHVQHAAYSFKVKNSRKLRDGDKYSGHLYNPLGKQSMELKGDYYWKSSTLQAVAREVGFEIDTVKPIADKSALGRKGSEQPAYLMITMRKPEANEPKHAKTAKPSVK